MNVFYIFYEPRYEYIKRKTIRSRYIISWGVFGGNLGDLIDHYDYCEFVIFECLVPKDDIERYFLDLIKYPYKFHKVINFLIEIESTDLVDNNPDVYLNMFGLRSRR